jgi:hypothetical protein
MRLADAKARVLQEDIRVLTLASEEYERDHGAPPADLEELVRAGYLRAVPVNPFDGEKIPSVAAAAAWERHADR